MAVNYLQIEEANDLAKIILLHRKKSGLSRKELCLLAGIGKTALYDIEHGKTTYQIDTLLRIMNVLNIKLFAEGPFTENKNE